MSKTILQEKHLEELGFEKRTMLGTGWNSINSMCDAVYWYKNGRVSINCTRFWTWFLDSEQDNSIAVGTKEELKELLITLNR